MPTLKQLTCSVEGSDSGIPLPEHSTSYADGFVRTYIAVPSMPTPFSIRLRSNGYIAPGLAMFVYLDGVYQCNRNRHNLKIPDGTSTRKQTEVNFHVRQKEEMMIDGTYRAKQWRFQKLDVVSNRGELKNLHLPHAAEFVGTIEVVVLRCLGLRVSSATIPQHQITRSTIPAQAPNFDKSNWFYNQYSDDDSWSSSSSASAVRGIFDGACDYTTKPSGSMAFGGDMAWDDLSPNPDQPKQWRSSSRVSTHRPDKYLPAGPGSNSGNGGTRHSGARDRSQDRFSQDLGSARSDDKRSHNSPNSQANAEQNSSSAKNNTWGSIGPRHAPVGSGLHQNGPNDSAAADAPAVVININHGRRPRRDPVWTEGSELDSINDNVPWQNVGQDDKNNQSQRREKPFPSGSIYHEGSKKSNYGVGNWQAQPACGSSGGDGGYSGPENWETAQPAVPGGWDTSNDQHQANNRSWDNNQSNNATTWKATSEGSQNKENNWNTNENDNSGWDFQGNNHNDWNTNENDNSGWDVQENNENNWNANENGNSGWGAHGNNDADTEENSKNQGQDSNNGWNAKDNGSAPGWNSSTQRNQGQNQQWNPKESNNAAQNSWAGDGGWYDRDSNQQNDKPPSNNQYPAPQSWGGKNEENNWAGPTLRDAGKTGAAPGFSNAQSKSRLSGVGSQEKSSSPFHFMNDPNQVNKPSSSHPSWKRSSPQAAQVESDATVPGMASQQSAPHLVTHGGPNPPQMGSFPSVGPGLPESDAFQSKPYWSSWKQPKEHVNRPNPFDPGFTSAEPLCKVTSEVAQRNNTTHQVHVDQSRPYAHRKASPKYMDSHDKPYAVFVFKYRSRGTLEQMLNTKLTETEAEKRLRMQGMTKDELIEEVLTVKANTTSQGSSESGSASASNQSGRSKSTIKGNNKAYNRNRHDADGVNFGAVNPQLSKIQIHGNNGSDRGSIHSGVGWGHDTQGAQNNTPSWDCVPTASNHERVTGWLGSDHGAHGGGGKNGGAGWTGTGTGTENGTRNGDPSSIFGGNANHDHNAGNMNSNTQAGGNSNWNGTANWTGQQGEGGGNGNGNDDDKQNIGSGGSGGRGGGGQATGSWQGAGDTAAQW